MYRCNNCNYESKKFFGLCPSCREGFGEEVEEYSYNSDKFSQPNKNIKLNIRNVSPDESPLETFRLTKFNNLNNILSSSKGFVEGQVVILGASPGVGKSTLCLSIASNDTLYISSEENYKQVNARALRVNPDTGIKILNSTSIDEILEAIRTTDAKLIIVDSLNSIEFGVGYITVAKYANNITNLIKEKNKACIIISQVSRTGEISGMNAISHIVDTVLYLERSEISSNIIGVTTKNRFGEIGEVAIFRHEDNGFIEIDIDNVEEEHEIGSTYTKTRFGHKNMTISIDALVTVAQGTYGMRKASGYNFNRLIQLVGILTYYGKFDLSSKDIYIAISNGLTTDDISIELAICNSILSSYFKTIKIAEAHGEVKLSGKIVSGEIDGKPINHINELINIYKNKGE